MPQDAFTLRLVAKELDTALRGGRVNKIAQPGREEISLLIYTGKRTLKLLLSANATTCGAYFTEDEGVPLPAAGFCMLLRKYLQSAELLSVSTPGFERVLLFRFRCVSDFSEKERVLCAEIMGKYSNLLLLQDGVILGALKTNSLDANCKRLVVAGAKYVPPAPQDKTDPSDYPALSRLFAENPDRGADFLFKRVAGLAPCTAEQIVSSYRGGDFAAHVRDFIFSDAVSPRVAEQNGVPTDFFARAEEGRPFGTLSEAQSYFYAAKRRKRAFEAGRRRAESALKTAAKKAEKRLAGILEKKLSCAAYETDRVKGELLTANLYALSRGMRSCELPNFYDENGKTLAIALDPQKSPAENAQAYFKKYRKQKRTLEALAPQEEETAKELEYVRGLLTALAVAETEDDLSSLEAELTAAGLLAEPKEKARREKPDIPYRVYEREGFRICAGRNNLQNDRLVRQSAPHDIWLHAQKRHSCHVVVRTNGMPVPSSVLQFCANLCAKYSDAGSDKIPVDYCAVKYVKKPPKSKAGFVIYSDFRTLLGDPQGV